MARVLPRRHGGLSRSRKASPTKLPRCAPERRPSLARSARKVLPVELQVQNIDRRRAPKKGGSPPAEGEATERERGVLLAIRNGATGFIAAGSSIIIKSCRWELCHGLSRTVSAADPIPRPLRGTMTIQPVNGFSFSFSFPFFSTGETELQAHA